jgi:hypothetical protein
VHEDSLHPRTGAIFAYVYGESAERRVPGPTCNGKQKTESLKRNDRSANELSIAITSLVRLLSGTNLNILGNSWQDMKLGRLGAGLALIWEGVRGRGRGSVK